MKSLKVFIKPLKTEGKLMDFDSIEQDKYYVVIYMVNGNHVSGKFLGENLIDISGSSNNKINFLKLVNWNKKSDLMDGVNERINKKRNIK